jgi:uncharacterized protein
VKFHLQIPTGDHLFSGHGAGYVAVNGVRYAKSVLVTPARVMDWQATDVDGLGAHHFQVLLEFKPRPEIVLLGTGAALRFPRRELSRYFAAERIGLEVMDNPAVCRTYNILAAEGRNVIAAVLLG